MLQVRAPELLTPPLPGVSETAWLHLPISQTVGTGQPQGWSQRTANGRPDSPLCTAREAQFSSADIRRATPPSTLAMTLSGLKEVPV